MSKYQMPIVWRVCVLMGVSPYHNTHNGMHNACAWPMLQNMSFIQIYGSLYWRGIDAECGEIIQTPVFLNEFVFLKV